MFTKKYAELGDLVAIDGYLIQAVLSMHWADYRQGSKKAKVHIDFDLNHSIPYKIFLTEGNGAVHQFVSKIISSSKTGVMYRGYQCHANFDHWQIENKKFVCRIRAKQIKCD